MVHGMDSIAVAFWGAYFGAVSLLLAGSVAAFARSLHRVALTAGLFGVISALFVAAFIGWLPLGDASSHWRWLTHVAVLSAAVLGLMILAMLGLLRRPAIALRVRTGIAALALAVLALGWLLEPGEALVLVFVATLCMALAVLLVCIRSARRGDRLAWAAVTGVGFMILMILGLSWIALERAATPVWVHALSAISGMAYVALMAVALWIRYSYLIELREVVSHGASYDPITRMRSHSETGQMVGLAFFGHSRGEERPFGVIAISIGNFSLLENLHGRAAVNHALFVCASRLRRCVPAHVEIGRLGDDGFLLLVRGSASSRRLAELARTVSSRLARPVVLSTSAELADLEAGRAHWVAQVGVGLLAPDADVRPSAAIAAARDMSRAAWSYVSRIAWREPGSNRIAELAPEQAG